MFLNISHRFAMNVCVIPEAEAAIEVLPPGLGVVLPGAVGAAGELSARPRPVPNLTQH